LVLTFWFYVCSLTLVLLLLVLLSDLHQASEKKKFQ